MPTLEQFAADGYGDPRDETFTRELLQIDLETLGLSFVCHEAVADVFTVLVSEFAELGVKIMGVSGYEPEYAEGKDGRWEWMAVGAALVVQGVEHSDLPRRRIDALANRLGLTWGIRFPDPAPELFQVAHSTKVMRAFGALAMTPDLSYRGIIDGMSAGPRVLMIQNKLLTLGFDVPLNGRYGAVTNRAIRQFQQDRKLRVTGIVNRDTYQALTSD